MPTLSAGVRTELKMLIATEIEAVNIRAQKMADAQWEQAESEVCRSLGYGDTLARIDHLRNEIQAMHKELNYLESSITGKARLGTTKEFRDLGIDVSANEYGHIRRYPTVFGHLIKTVWDIEVLKHLNETVPFLPIFNSLSQLDHTFRRELALCGNFKDARALYNRFYQKITAAIGTEIPGLLSEIQALPMLGPSE